VNNDDDDDDNDNNDMDIDIDGGRCSAKAFRAWKSFSGYSGWWVVGSG
jgi:hypothetical protein